MKTPAFDLCFGIGFRALFGVALMYENQQANVWCCKRLIKKKMGLVENDDFCGRDGDFTKFTGSKPSVLTSEATDM
jgi:hypothetical protein